MKTAFALFTAAVIGSVFCNTAAHAEGFTDGEVLFYGQVRQIGGAQATLLQSGTLEITFVNQADAANRVTLSAPLRPTGVGDLKKYSYSLGIPLKFLPDSNQKSAYLSISAQEIRFRVQNITIDGRPATLPDGSREFYGINFASRASQNRLDLIVGGDSTDTDGDGLPDWWEKLHGLDPNNPTDALADLDGDGWSNLSEFSLGSDPALSNTAPQLATTEILVPESGEAGLLLQVLDSDTAASDVSVVFTIGEGTGFDIKLDGTALASGETQPFSLTDLQSGRLTIAHSDPAATLLTLPVRLSDGPVGPVTTASSVNPVLVRVASASSVDGKDASLWLDGRDLPADGMPIGNWPDRSGNGLHAMQPLAEHQPLVTGRSADFAASSTAHLFFQDTALPVGNHTVLAAYQAADSSDHTETVLASNRGYLELTPTAQATSYPGAAHYQMDGLAVRGFENSSGAATTSIFRREDGLLQNIFGLAYDGENVTAEALDPVLPTLGARRSAIPNGSVPITAAFGGQLHELLVFPTALPEQKLRDVHDYLQSKWSDAIIWDLSTELKAITLSTGSGSQPRIIRGGHGEDVLGGGTGDDTISGGPGADTLTGDDGTDRFVFGNVDSGSDRITDFDLERDIIDLSALFWGMTGDARDFLEVRLDTNFSTPIPTIDSVLLVRRPDGSVQEIMLQNRVVGATELVQLIVEGHIRMGGLGIPTGVQLALGPENTQATLRESLSQPFSIEISRSGEGVAGALDVPLGFFEDALGRELIVEGVSEAEGQRAVVSFARGERSKTLVIRPLPDLESEGLETWQVAVLPNYKYSVGGAPVQTTVDDIPNLWVELLEANAVAGIAQAARVNIHRDGSLSQSLTVDLDLRGTAVEGVHIGSVPRTITIPAGANYQAIGINALSEGLVDGPRAFQLQLVSRDDYQLGNPHEAMLYAGLTVQEAAGAGFDRWLSANSGGDLSSLAGQMAGDPELLKRSLRAYAFGGDPAGNTSESPLSIRIVNGRPEISVPGESSSASAADVRWGVETSVGLHQWENAGNAFVELPEPGGFKLVGEPLVPGDDLKFYRLNIALNPGQQAGPVLAALTGADKFGINGDVSWNSGQSTGDLRSAPGPSGGTGRIVAELEGPATLRFEMEIIGAGGEDSFAFYIDGVRVSQTNGGVLQVEKNLTGSGSHLLMWEFERGTGQAVIRHLPL